MSDDAARPEPKAPSGHLPAITAVQIKRVPYHPPKLRYFKSYLSGYTEAIEFTVRLDGPIRSVALPPVLYVGQVAVNEAAAVSENVYRFLAFEPTHLREGATITLGWPGQQGGPAPQATSFRYQSPAHQDKK